MGKGLFRRVAGRGRSRRSAKRIVAGAAGNRDTSGQRYRVVPVEEEPTEFMDPPRKWPRVGSMLAGWALVLALGAWIAPGFAAAGSDENNDPRDQAPTTAKGAAWSYLHYGSDNDTSRAEALLCEDASPEVSPADLDAIKASYAEELGGITRIDLETGDPVATTGEATVAGTVKYISQGTQRFEEFTVTLQEADDAYCVSNAVQVAEEEPGGGTTGDAVDPKVVATDFLRAIVVDRDPTTATTSQCETYAGITPQQLGQAITDWAATNGETSGFLTSVEPAESTESSITMFESGVELRGALNHESFTFRIGVQGDCVASLEGGDDLMSASED